MLFSMIYFILLRSTNKSVSRTPYFKDGEPNSSPKWKPCVGQKLHWSLYEFMREKIPVKLSLQKEFAFSLSLNSAGSNNSLRDAQNFSKVWLLKNWCEHKSEWQLGEARSRHPTWLVASGTNPLPQQPAPVRPMPSQEFVFKTPLKIDP